MDKEIVKACIKYKNKLFTGFDHGECFENLLKEEQPKDMTELEQGFIDNELNFVDRKSAMVIANIAGQLKFKPVKETLISEDLHLDWLNRQAKQIANLEAKLAEKEKELEKCNDEWTEICNGKLETINRLIEEKHELQQQLAEKNELIKTQYDGIDYWKSLANKRPDIDFAIKNRELEQQLAEKDIEIERLKQNYDEVWEDTYFSVREDFELNNNCNECRRCYAEEFSKQLAEKDATIKYLKDEKDGSEQANELLNKMFIEVKEELAEKEKELEELKKEIRDELVDNNMAILELQQSQNQTAIAELNNILDTFAIFVNEEKESMVSPDGSGNLSLLEYIENRIDTLKGDANE